MGMKAVMLPSEAARILGVSATYVRVLADRGDLPATRTEGGVRLLDRAAVEKLARDRGDRNAERQVAVR
ncbi:MAG TPA: helix-turn-helix domain-containing protein [bacterium]|nr:helix-turn-helix domain-containing protein [bacterium]